MSGENIPEIHLSLIYSSLINSSLTHKSGPFLAGVGIDQAKTPGAAKEGHEAGHQRGRVGQSIHERFIVPWKNVIRQTELPKALVPTVIIFGRRGGYIIFAR